MKFMTDTQCAYVAGQNKELPLGGVGCHAYFEFSCGKINEIKLADAWETLFEYHCEMRAIYANGIIMDLDDKPANSKLVVLDYRKDDEEEKLHKLKEFRNMFEARNCNTEHAECCGLWLIKLDEGKNLLAFDWSLIAGDVKSFVLVLDELARLYSGETVDAIDNAAEILLEKRREAASNTKKIAEEIIETDVCNYPVDINLELLEVPEKLSGCHYFSVDCWVDIKNIDALIGSEVDGKLMTAFVMALCDITGDSGLLVNYPSFKRSTQETNSVGDFTDIKLIPIKYEKSIEDSVILRTNMDTYHRYMSFSGYKQVKIRRKISKHFPNVKYIGPIVFSPVMDKPLLSEGFMNNIGTLSYMISQTPQVWLDVQTFYMGDKLLISIVYPKEMFEREYVKRIADEYAKKIDKILNF